MQCFRCKSYVNEDMIYCPRCGQYLKETINICNCCGATIPDGFSECPFCNQQKQEQYQGYWKKAYLWIIAGLLIIASAASDIIMNLDPLTNYRDTTNIALTNDSTSLELSANNRTGGICIVYNHILYYIHNGSLYQSECDNLTQTKKLIDDCVGYLSVYDGCLYYCDSQYNYCSYNLKTKKTELVLVNVYYPVIDGHKIYYQQDSDHESLYVFDIETQDNKKLNDCVTYDITVDGDYIYYLTHDNQKYRVERLHQNTNKIDTIYEGKCQFVLNQKSIYICDMSHIIEIDKNSLESIEHDIKTDAISIVDGNLIAMTANEISSINLKENQQEVIYQGDYFYDIQCAGNCILLLGFDRDRETVLTVLDLKGNSLQLNAVQKDISDIDGMKEF